MDAAETLFASAKSRVFPSENKFEFEEVPKWKILKEIIDEIKQENKDDSITLGKKLNCKFSIWRKKIFCSREIDIPFIIHNALKLEKNAISKVQKHIFCYFKNGKKSIFALEKRLNLPKIQLSDWKK